MMALNVQWVCWYSHHKIMLDFHPHPAPEKSCDIFCDICFSWITCIKVKKNSIKTIMLSSVLKDFFCLSRFSVQGVRSRVEREGKEGAGGLAHSPAGANGEE